MKFLFATFILWVFSLPALHCQDLHLSNYQPAGMLFNPAVTALNGADVQVGVQYRSQWAVIPQAYTTMGVTGEWKHKQLGFGMQVQQNKAGEASLKTTGTMLTGAYHKQLAQDGILSLGLGLGRIQKRVNPALLTFDNQYTEGVGFDAGLPSNENFTRTNAAFTDVTVGLLWQGNWGLSKQVRSTAGLSLSHIHLPDHGFFGSVVELPMKTVVHGNLDIKIDNQLVLSPHLLVQKQGVHKEIVGGLKINGSFDRQSEFHAGLAYRWDDAVIISTGLEIGNKSIWVSYDANTSTLKSATAGRGAWELGLYLRFDRKKKKQLKDTDGDGVYDHRDKCPKEPGLSELEGCPNLVFAEKEDSDGDGVTDDLDRCPLEPGLPCFYGCNDRDRDGTLDQDDACPGLFGHPDNQGCPVKDRDSDKDGIPDSEDYCVYLKGLPQFHGCPDSDQDGISDIDDECPYIKGVKEKNGCPAAISNNARPTVTIEFDTDQASINPEYQLLLNDFLQEVRGKQGLRLMVSGHTDAEGTAAYNYELALRRAKRVQNYLSRRGIAFTDMELISYGESIPVRSNGSENGKAENRRVEVVILSGYD